MGGAVPGQSSIMLTREFKPLDGASLNRWLKSYQVEQAVITGTLEADADRFVASILLELSQKIADAFEQSPELFVIERQALRAA